MERIDIVVDPAEMTGNDEKRERLRRTRSFDPTDRVPVVMNTNQWTALAGRGRRFIDYIRSPADNLREQILNAKWRIEQVRDDQPIPMEGLRFQPDLGCLRGVEFDMEITWSDDHPPKCTHPLTDPGQIDSLRVPDPSGGLNARRIEWYHGMVEASKGLDVRLNGQQIPIEITLTHPGGPIPSAFALAGPNLFLWMAAEPERTHRLMDIVTESHMRSTRFFDVMMGRDPRHPINLGCDIGEVMSPNMYREFVVPYYVRIWEAYGGQRGFHNCGQNQHLLDIIRDDLGIASHNSFGSCVDCHLLGEKMAGRVVLFGGPDPSLIQSGSWEDIAAQSREYIEALGRQGGYILSCGGGAAPGTPVGNYQALLEASKFHGPVMGGA